MQAPAENFVGGGGGSSPEKAIFLKRRKNAPNMENVCYFPGWASTFILLPPPPLWVRLPLCAYMCHHHTQFPERECFHQCPHEDPKKNFVGGGSGEGQPKKAPPPPTISIKTKVEEDNKDKRHGT